jgi:pSer/pThr/pTyr-binding forkhead associated (FHA) protein
MYKYSCRKCPIRNRCIEESDTSPSAKEMIRNAFAARTDTLATWGVLQKNCLLIKAEERRIRMANEESLLSRRLREVREAKKQAAKESNQSSSRPSPDYLRPVSPVATSQNRPHPTETLPSNQPVPQVDPFERKRIQEAARPCWLTVSSSKRHVALPDNGEVVLGRFDPHLGIPPDIDLAYEDWDHHSISRRHAKIVGVNGHHRIEDLGSRNGSFLNGEHLPPGPSRLLQPGARINIGDVSIVYDLVPATILNIRPTQSDRHSLMVTFNGRKLTIFPPDEVIIGRSDRHIDFVPQIDLSADGDAAMRVSRRHAIITWRNSSPYLEDLGSGFGTRLNGETLLIGQAVPLKPGDHIWLGGCVLAYDLEI